MVFLKNALMCIKKVKLINPDCLPILMLLYIVLYIVIAYLMLYIVHAFLMLFAALSNAVCLYDAFFLPTISAYAFIFMFCLGSLTHSLFISCVNWIMHSAFNLLVFPNSMFTPLSFFVFLLKGLCALHYYYFTESSYVNIISGKLTGNKRGATTSS